MFNKNDIQLVDSLAARQIPKDLPENATRLKLFVDLERQEA